MEGPNFRLFSVASKTPHEGIVDQNAPDKSDWLKQCPNILVVKSPGISLIFPLIFPLSPLNVPQVPLKRPLMFP